MNLKIGSTTTLHSNLLLSKSLGTLADKFIPSKLGSSVLRYCWQFNRKGAINRCSYCATISNNGSPIGGCIVDILQYDFLISMKKLTVSFAFY